MVTVQFSKREELILPEPLGRALGLCEGDRVEVQRQGGILRFRRRTEERSPDPLTDLTRIVSSSRPVGSVDVDSYMDKYKLFLCTDNPSFKPQREDINL